jgi:diacylglycerol kinase family enzyme
MSGIGVILNPYSRNYRNNPERAKKMSFIVGDKASFKATEDLGDLQRVAEEFKSRDIDLLAISGGDGTLHTVLSYFSRIFGDKPLPQIALLRGGTLNNVATYLKIKGDPEHILSRLVIHYHEGLPLKHKTVHLLKINNEVGFVWGNGIIYRFMEVYYKAGLRSPTGAAIVLGRLMASALFNGPRAMSLFEPFHARVTVDGKLWPFDQYNALFGASINHMGLNFRVYHLVDKHPGCMHVHGIHAKPRELVSYMPRMGLGHLTHWENHLEQPAQDMLIELDKPLAYTIDGDMKEPTTRLHIQMGPKLTILTPE